MDLRVVGHIAGLFRPRLVLHVLHDRMYEGRGKVRTGRIWLSFGRMRIGQHQRLISRVSNDILWLSYNKYTSNMQEGLSSIKECSTKECRVESILASTPTQKTKADPPIKAANKASNWYIDVPRKMSQRGGLLFCPVKAAYVVTSPCVGLSAPLTV